MTWLVALGSGVLGVVLAWLYLRARETGWRVQASTTATQLAETRAQADALRIALDTARANLAARDTELARLTGTLEGERKAAAEKLEALQNAQVRLTDVFKALSADALQSNNESFLRLAQTALAQFQEGARGDLDKRQQAIDSLVKPIRESLEKVDTRIGEIERTRAAAYGQLSEQLKSLGTAQTSLQAEAAKLSLSLRSTTTAGTWGELQLRRVVELAGMTSYCDFTEQESVTDSTGRLRADLVVRLPGGQQIVIDAKAPNDAYREAANAVDETVRAAKLAEHAAKVRGHIDALSAKEYWAQFQPSPEFVVLFLPGDQFLSGALQSDPALLDRAISRKVLLATPATLIALLKAAAYGWRQEAVSRNAEEIAKLGRELYDRIATFAEHLDNLGAGLKNAVGHYNKAIGSFEGTVLPGARKFDELGARGGKTLPAPGGLDLAPRDLTRRN